MTPDRATLVIAKCEAFTAWLDSPPHDAQAKATYYTALARLRQHDAETTQDHTLDARSQR